MARKTTGRIEITANVPDALKLAKKVYEKHLAEGDKSYLKDLDGVDWAVTGPRIDPCLVNHDEAEALTKKAEKVYRQRDADLAPILEILRISKNALKGKYTKNPKALGDWGFTVDDTPKAKKDKP